MLAGSALLRRNVPPGDLFLEVAVAVPELLALTFSAHPGIRSQKINGLARWTALAGAFRRCRMRSCSSSRSAVTWAGRWSRPRARRATVTRASDQWRRKRCFNRFRANGNGVDHKAYHPARDALGGFFPS